MDAYEYQPETGGGLFVKLAAKGDSVEVRLASTPVYEPKVWKEGEKKPVDQATIAGLSADKLKAIRQSAKYKVSEQFSWVVIDRTDGQARLLTLPATFYNQIKELAQNPKWGDPTKYDVTVTRTEDPGRSYYKVIPDPNKSELTAEEKMAAEAIDVQDLKPFAKPTSTFGGDVKPVENTDDQLDLESDSGKEKDVVIEDLDEKDPIDDL